MTIFMPEGWGAPVVIREEIRKVQNIYIKIR